GFTDEPIIDIRGKVSLEFGSDSIKLEASGTIKIIKLGNVGSAAALFVLKIGNTASGLPEFWGVAKIQANLDFLKNVGLFVEGSAMLQINTSSTAKTETIALEGIPGDLIEENLALATSGLASAPLAEVDISQEWVDLLNGLNVDDPFEDNDTITVDFTGAKIQTIISGRTYKIITADIPTDDQGGTRPAAVFFVEKNSDGTVNLRSEAQTFELAAQSFSIEIIGSLKIKANGSSDPNADNWVELFGGFYLGITPQRFELFVSAYARIPVLGLSGDAVGLIIIDGRFEGPGIPGIAMMLDVELTFGATPDAPDDGRDDIDQSIFDGIFELRGKVTLTLNTTLREQVFEIPDSFLALMPDDAATVVTIFDAAPAIDGSRSSEAGVDPAIYISANIQGSIVLFDTITLTGFLAFTASVDTSGNAFVRITGAVSTKIEYLGALSGGLDLMLFTDFDGAGPGILGRIQLAIADGGMIPGVVVNGQFLLEVNSYGSAKVIQSLQTNAEANPAYTGSQPNILATDPDTGLFVIGDVTIESGLRLLLAGKLKLGPLVDIEGHFELAIRYDSLEIKAMAKMQLLGIGGFDIDAVLRIDADGLAAYINVDIGLGFGGDLGLQFEVGATLELYIGSLSEKTLTLVDGTTVAVKQGFKLTLLGSVTFLGFAEASGYTIITLQSDVFSIEFDITLDLGP
ncbi:MAG: hypothetical protein KAT93_09065, partial [Desulfuromonadales bacterium]|nr:hypothetical protein [Desulfuromonadales bacterium]